MADETTTPSEDAPDLTTVSAEQLAELEAQAIEAFDSLNEVPDDDITGEQLEELASLADSITACRAERERRTTEAKERADQRKLLADAIHPEGDADDEKSDESAEATDDTEAVDEASDDTEKADEKVDDEEKEPVMAGGRMIDLAAIRRHAPKPKAERKDDRPAVTITASADIPGVPAGGRLTSLLDVTKAMSARARALPVVASGAGRAGAWGGAPVVSIDRGIPEDRWLTDNEERNEAIVAAATSPKALTAAGWCAPCEPVYDFFEVEATDGLIDLPTVSNTRGCSKFPVGPTLADVQAALFHWTSDMDKDTDPTDPTKSKGCLEIPCVTWVDCEQEADGLCLTASNLSDRSMPEATRRYVSLALAAHEHKISGSKIDQMVSAATAVTIGADALKSDAYGDLLGALDLQVADLRSEFRMSESATLEIVLPTWVRPMLRANLAQRAGVDLLAVTDQMLSAHFATRHVSPQFVQDWQALYGNGVADPTNWAAATAWPATLDVLVYAAGNYLLSTGGTIDLGVVRDSVLNSTNDFVAAWSEEFYSVCAVGKTARVVTVPINVDGVTACCA